MQESVRNTYNLVKASEEKSTYKDEVADGRIILEWILHKQRLQVRMESSDWAMGLMEDSQEHGNETNVLVP
jgi:hypothetical protein